LPQPLPRSCRDYYHNQTDVYILLVHKQPHRCR
jgi:hypothetical protein